MISVVIATYNGIKFIKEQLDSITNQTMVPDEIVVQDDFSSDGTYRFVLEYSKKYPDIIWKIEQNVNNLGYKRNFYTAICKADGDYIFLCDQDDIWLNTKIEKMINVMKKNSNIQLLMSNLKSFYQENCKNIVREEKKGFLKLIHFNNLNHCVNTPRPGCSFCIRKDLIKEYINKVDFEIPHDNLIWHLASLDKRAYLYNRITMKYRRHSSNASNNKENSKDKRLKAIQRQIYSINFLENISKSERNIIFFRKQKEVFEHRYESIKNMKLLENIKLIFKIKYYYNFRLWFVDLYYIRRK